MSDQADGQRTAATSVPFAAYVGVSTVAFGVVLDHPVGVVLGSLLLAAVVGAVWLQRQNPATEQRPASVAALARGVALGWVLGLLFVLLGVVGDDVRGVYLGCLLIGFTSLTSWYQRHTADTPRRVVMTEDDLDP